MDDMKDKLKGFMKKVNKSSSSGHFKGPGRVLGSSSSGPTNPAPAPAPARRILPNVSSVSSSNSKHSPQSSLKLDDQITEKPSFSTNLDSTKKKSNEFDSYKPLITSSTGNKNGYSLNVFECPVCGRAFGSEEEVSDHVDNCLNESELNSKSAASYLGENSVVFGVASELDDRVGAYLSGNPPASSVEIVLRLLRNVVKEPENPKFWRVRLGNAKIREAIGEVSGGVELLECVGFVLREEDGEMWAVMEVPSEGKIGLIKKTISLLEPGKVESFVSTTPLSTKAQEAVFTTPSNEDESNEPNKVDRQVRVFFSVPESVAAKIELPDSFYNLSLEEVKRDAEARRKKIAESQLLIPKTYKEKQAKAAKKIYMKTVIRVQFPDGVVLQGVFSPREPTVALYEFVSTALKDPSLEFELLHPVAIRRRGPIPHFPAPGGRAITLEEEDLVPAALIKFKPLETDSVVFTGLCNELLEISEPLVS